MSNLFNPIPGLKFVVAETQVFNGTAPTTFTDLDLSAVVGSNRALVLLKLFNSEASGKETGFRRNGETELVNKFGGESVAAVTLPATSFGLVLVYTDDAGIIEWARTSGATAGTTVDVVAFLIPD